MTENEMRKRKRELDQCDDPVTNSDETKKLKVIPQNENLHQVERKRNTTPKVRKSVQKKKENTTPAPILNFLNKFNFKPKKIETKEQESEVKIVKNEIKTEKEIFMSKFSKLKNVFEKEKVKTINKNKNSKFKTSTAKRNNFVPKQETPPNKLHHINIKKVNSEEKILLVRKVVPQNEATSRSPPNIEKEKETDEERIPPRKVRRQVTLKVTTTKTLPHQPPLTKPPTNQQPPPTGNHKEPTTTTTSCTKNNHPPHILTNLYHVPPATTTARKLQKQSDFGYHMLKDNSTPGRNSKATQPTLSTTAVGTVQTTETQRFWLPYAEI